jgi:hypothetical protein
MAAPVTAASGQIGTATAERDQQRGRQQQTQRDGNRGHAPGAHDQTADSADHQSQDHQPDRGGGQRLRGARHVVDLMEAQQCDHGQERTLKPEGDEQNPVPGSESLVRQPDIGHHGRSKPTHGHVPAASVHRRRA